MARFMNVEEDRSRRRWIAIDDISDADADAHFRFSKEGIQRLVDLFAADLPPMPVRKRVGRRAVPASIQMMAFLAYLASPNRFVDVGMKLGISKSTAWRCFHRVLRAISKRRNEFIRFPTDPEEILKHARAFRREARFPCVLGLVDGTHVRIYPPRQDQEAYYTGRLHKHTLNVLIAIDGAGLIAFVDATQCGANHDSFVMNNSALHRGFQSGRLGGGVLLADYAYGNQRWMYTPFLHPVSNAQVRFNTSHVRTRGLIEKLFGRLKRRWPQLHFGVRLRIRNASAMVMACCCIYNLAVLWGVPDFPENPDEPNVPIDNDRDAPLEERELLDRIVFAEQHFAE